VNPPQLCMVEWPFLYTLL